jgi:hypothetical protein
MSDAIEAALLPCPFCGGDAIVSRPSLTPKMWSISCRKCDAGPAASLSLTHATSVWNRRPALTAYEAAKGDRPHVSVREMKLGPGSDGEPRSDFFVSIKVGDREVTPHMFRERFKSEYHVALYDWLLNGGEKPELMAFAPGEWPARELGASVEAAKGGGVGVPREWLRNKIEADPDLETEAGALHPAEAAITSPASGERDAAAERICHATGLDWDALPEEATGDAEDRKWFRSLAAAALRMEGK